MLIKILVGILAFIGAVVVLAIAALLIGYVVFAYRMQKKIRAFLDTEGLDIDAQLDDEYCTADVEIPPLTINLVPTDNPDWIEFGESVEKTLRILRRSHFKLIGDFHDEESDSPYRFLISDTGELIAFIHLSAHISQPYLELFAEKANGGYIRVHNFPSATMQAPSADTCRHFQEPLDQEQTVRKILSCARKLVKAHTVKPVAESNVIKQFVKYFSDGIAFRIRRGGLSQEEIEATFRYAGLEIDQELIDRVRNSWQYAIENYLIEQSSKASQQDEEGYEVLAVHDGSNKSFLIERIDLFLVMLGERLSNMKEVDIKQMREELIGLLNRFSPREAIARFRPILPQALRYSLIDQLKKPIEADLYLIPEE